MHDVNKLVQMPMLVIGVISSSQLIQVSLEAKRLIEAGINVV
ncbi:MAG: hypothetical protein Q9M50_01365 [Methylococcales bacterium]|nr:hypothetical protein [Methylococcales bacterium]